MLDADARQVDGGKGVVSAARGDLWSVHIAHDAGAAAHRRHLGLRTARHIVLQVERRVQELKVREQALRADAACQLEQIIVGIVWIIVHALFDLEDEDREDRRLTIAQSGLLRQHQLLADHAAFRRSIRAEVDAGERNLRAGAGMHRIQVVDKAFHRLIRQLFGLLLRFLVGKRIHQIDLLRIQSVFLGEHAVHGVEELFAHAQRRALPALLFHLLHICLDVFVQ